MRRCTSLRVLEGMQVLTFRVSATVEADSLSSNCDISSLPNYSGWRAGPTSCFRSRGDRYRICIRSPFLLRRANWPQARYWWQWLRWASTSATCSTCWACTRAMPAPPVSRALYPERNGQFSRYPGAPLCIHRNSVTNFPGLPAAITILAERLHDKYPICGFASSAVH